MEENTNAILADIRAKEAELRAQGWEYGWHKPRNYVGWVYIMENPSFPDYVKLGYADDLAKRVKNLSGTNVPTPFHCYAAFKVTNRLEDKTLHRLLDKFRPDLRYSPDREFYIMSHDDAYSLLECIASISGEDECLVKNPLNDSYFGAEPETDVESTGSRFSFARYGISTGAVLTLKEDETVSCVVSDDCHVKYNGVEYSPSGFVKKFTKNPSHCGGYHLKYNGVLLKNLLNDDGSQPQPSKRPPLDFLKCGMRPGDKLVCHKDPSIIVYVEDGRHVKCNGETMSLAGVINKYLPKYAGYAATSLFSFNGEHIGEIADRTMWKDLPHGHFSKTTIKQTVVAEKFIDKMNHWMSTYKLSDLGISVGDYITWIPTGAKFKVIDVSMFKGQIMVPGHPEIRTMGAYNKIHNPNGKGQVTEHFSWNGKVIYDLAKEIGRKKIANGEL